MDQRPLEYRYALVAYIDLLGFKKLVEKERLSTIKEVLKEFQNYLRKDYANPSSENYDDPLYESFVFSDSIIRVTYIDHPNNCEHAYGSIFIEILALAHALIALFPYGILFRGALTLGEIYVSTEKDQVFGPALVEAVKIEEQIEKPCIVVDEKVLGSISDPRCHLEQHTAEEEEEEYIRRFIAEDFDVDHDSTFHYIDIFSAANEETDCLADWLIITRDFILENINEHANSGRILEKYVWLRDRFNDFVNGLDEGLVYEAMGIERDSLLIPNSQVRKLKGLLKKLFSLCPSAHIRKG